MRQDARMIVLLAAVALALGQPETRTRAAIAIRLGQDADARELDGIVTWFEQETVLDVTVWPIVSRKDTCAYDDACLLERARHDHFELLFVVDYAVYDGKPNTASDLGVVRYYVEDPSTPAAVVLEGRGVGDPKEILSRLLPERLRAPARLKLTGLSGALAKLGTEACVLPCTMGRLPPGTHLVELEFEGQHFYREIDVRPAANLVLEIERPEKRSIWKSPWLWLGAGIVIAGAAAGAVVAVSGSGDPGVE